MANPSQHRIGERDNILSPEHKARLYPFYARLRAEAPVYATTSAGRAKGLAHYPLRRRGHGAEGRTLRQGPVEGAQAVLDSADVQGPGGQHAPPRRRGACAAASAGAKGILAAAGRTDAAAHRGPCRRTAGRRARPGQPGSDPRLRAAHPDDDHRGNAGRAGGGPAQVPALVAGHRLRQSLVPGDASGRCRISGL